MLTPAKNEVRKPTKTISGITPIAVMLPPRKCKHGVCLYCPSLNVPQSYTPKSPVVMRASLVNYNSYEQVKGRLKAFELMNHPTEKIEIIIMGGTFLEYPKKFQYEFIKEIYNALNKTKSKTLEEAQRKNEKAKHRCVALCIETRPDKCSDKDIKKMRDWGATRVELGVQIIDDKIYKKINRGHKVKDVISATRRLKNAGFKIGYHIMPGLPGSNPKKDLEKFREIFSNENFKPDQLKIYPCQVIPGSELEKIYLKGNYKPYSKEQTEKILIQMLKIVPRYCRVMRIMREIPPEYLTAGITRIDLRKEIEQELRKKNSKLKEIRYREIGFNYSEEKPKLKITKYRASGGEEYFLEFVDERDVLFGLLRLRIFEEKMRSPLAHNLMASKSPRDFAREIYKNFYSLPQNRSPSPDFFTEKIINVKNNKINFENSLTYSKKSATKGVGIQQAIIREVHVYGKSLNIGEKGKNSQHIGLGKELIKKAEEITRKNKIKKLKIISGIGVREYYRKLGYHLKGSYMVKEFKTNLKYAKCQKI